MTSIKDRTAQEWLDAGNTLRAALRLGLDATQALWAVAHALETLAGHGLITDALEQARGRNERLREMRKAFADQMRVIRWLDYVELKDYGGNNYGE